MQEQPVSSKEKRRAYNRNYMRTYQKKDKWKTYIKAYNARKKLQPTTELIADGSS